LLNYIAFMTSI